MRVYGIYEVGADVPLYIGSTQADLKTRFASHVNCQKVVVPARGAHPVVLSRMNMFRAHRTGLIKLEIRQIALCGSRQEMLDTEYAEIAKHRPRLNVSTGKTRGRNTPIKRGHGSDVLAVLRSRVEVAMIARDWSPADLCRASELPKATVSRFLNGGNTTIDYSTVLKLEAAIAQ